MRSWRRASWFGTTRRRSCLATSECPSASRSTRTHCSEHCKNSANTMLPVCGLLLGRSVVFAIAFNGVSSGSSVFRCNSAAGIQLQEVQAFIKAALVCSHESLTQTPPLPTGLPMSRRAEAALLSPSTCIAVTLHRVVERLLGWGVITVFPLVPVLHLATRLQPRIVVFQHIPARVRGVLRCRRSSC